MLSVLSVNTSSAANGEEELTIVAPSQVNETDSFVVTVLSNDIPVDGVYVQIKYNASGAMIELGIYNYTNSSGQAVLFAPETPITSIAGEPADMTAVIEASKEGYENATKNITVINVPLLLINVSGQRPDGKYNSPITVTVYDESLAMIDGATVTLIDGHGEQVETTVNGQATFTVDHEFVVTIKANKSGYRDAPPVHIPIRNPTALNGPLLLTAILYFGAIIGVIAALVVIVILVIRKFKNDKNKD